MANGDNWNEFQLPTDPEEVRKLAATLLRRNRELETQLGQYVEASTANKATPSAPSSGIEAGLEVTPLNEADVTLRRLVTRIAMILQAEKIVIMFFDRELGELKGIPPAYGVEDAQLNHFRVRATQGVSGQVFREGDPVIFHDVTNDPRTKQDPFGLFHVSNGITVPLVIEQRDEENRVISRTTIGVLHAFNKRHNEDFNEEDVRLLERMAKNVGSIIANLQLYRAVVEQKEELLQTFESLTAGLILISPDGKVSQMNATARTICQAQADSVGRPFHEVVHQEDFAKLYNATMRGDDLPKVEISVVVGGTERVYQVQAAQVKNEEGRDLGVVAIFMDVTEMKNIDKMKSSFVAMASHELRTPLTAIRGFTSTLLQADDFTADERREFLMIIEQECDRLRRLIDDLLNTSRIEAGLSLKPNYSEVELRALLDKVLVIQRQSTHKHTLVLNVETEIPNILGDQDQLDQVLTNLLNNAIKYSPNGGTITMHAKREGDFVMIGVQDQGIGIPKEHLNRVFDKFHRVHNEDNRKIYGTGLGLYLVKHLVEAIHDGKIWVESEVGVGSTFWIKIPTTLDVEKKNAELG